MQKEKHELIQKFEDSQQQLQDSRSDLRLLREQIVRQRVGSCNEGLTTSIKVELDNSNLVLPININSALIPSINNQQAKSLPTSPSSTNLNSNINTIRENLIKEIELLREQKTTIENDLKIALCQKEEIEIERDSFKNKYIKVNEFLMQSVSVDLLKNDDEPDNESLNSTIEAANIDLNESPTSPNYANTRKFNFKLKTLNKEQLKVNIDELISQNKYLNESNAHLKGELENMKSTLKKYKQSVQAQNPKDLNNNNNNNPFSSSSTQASKSDLNANLNSLGESNIINKVQIKSLLGKAERFISEFRRIEQQQQQANERPLIELIGEFKLVIESLLECLNDKILANSHQRKVNKMLATRIQELEKNFKITITPSTPPPNSSNKPQNSGSPFSALPSTLVLDEPLVPTKVDSMNGQSSGVLIDLNQK